MSEPITKILQRSRRRDRWASRLIILGGVSVIGTVLVMLVLILRVALPLFYTPSVELRQTITLDDNAETIAVGLDDYFEKAYSLDDHGAVTFYDLAQQASIETVTIRQEYDGRVVDARTWGSRQHALIWDDGMVSLFRVRLVPQFDENSVRTITHSVIGRSMVNGPETASLLTDVRRTGEEGLVRADVLAGNAIRVYQETVTEDLFGDTETSSAIHTIDTGLPGKITAVTLDEEGRRLYAGTDTGHLGCWRLSPEDNPALLDSVHIFEDSRGIATLNLVFGDVSLAVGATDGTLETWFFVLNEETGTRSLKRIHELPDMADAVKRIVPSRRNKGLVTLGANGDVQMVHATSERQLWKLPVNEPQQSVYLSEKGDGLASLGPNGTLNIWDVHVPHPETSLRTLFSKVWYENYPKPEYVWQSSASSDDYEPKLSMIPLMFGSLKGTLYALIFAVPLSLLGAIYTSQFASPRWREVIKPVVEVMATIPSVVIGFLIALWLAPIVEDYIIAFFLVLIYLPLLFVPIVGLLPLWEHTSFSRRMKMGYEFLAVMPFLAVTFFLAYATAPWVEARIFDGDFQNWLYMSLGERYDQRNAIIIAFGLGFAAIPIIFTISEDALSNVPPSLRASSLALGASRWQTVWRVILPSASPGIFAAVIIGFGRVIGETMIVLMATGNTPILDWSPFNGMRTLSANIAVEIPEAPVDGTLYRVLFLSAVILFGITFFLNTAAELTRQRLRKKYGQFK